MSQITASVRFIGKQPIRLMASLSAAFTSPIYGAYQNGDKNVGWVKLTVDGLAANTLYYVRPDFVGAVTARLPVGTARTQPAGAHSFSFGAGSCWNPGRSWNNKFIATSIANKVAANELQFFIHMGDIHYADIQVDDVTLFRGEVDQVFLDPKRNTFMRSCPVYYMYDDHDAGGPDNGNRVDAGTAAGIEFIRKAAPNPAMAQASVSKSPYYSFIRGRCRFIVTDVRNDRDPITQMPASSRRVMQAEQTDWFYAQLTAANAADQPVFWVSTKPWHDASADSWGGYATHRTEIVNFITANGMTNKIAILSGDMHALAYDNGTNSPGGLRLLHCGPLDQSNSVKGGPYSHGPFTTNETQYGLIDVTDPGSGAVTVRFRGIACASSSETVVIDQTFSLG